MHFNIKNRETTSFKKRYPLGFKKLNLIFGDFAIILCKSYNIEYIYIYNFKRYLKRYYSFKKGTKKVWLFLHKNYPLTKKSKNSRMGKGKGALARFCARVVQNHNLFEFSGFSINEVLKLKLLLKKKTNIPTKLFGSFFFNTDYNVYQKNERWFFFKNYQG